MATVKQILQLAVSQVGYKEGKNNDTKYGIAYGMNHAAWCHEFVWWLGHECGLRDNVDLPRTASCPRGLLWFKGKGRLYKTPLPGDFIYFKWTSNHTTEASHVGIVTEVKNGRVYTIEGNAGTASDRVVRKSYSLSYSCIVGYGRLPLERDPEPSPDPSDPIDHAAVKAMQTALNRSYSAGLTVDGIFGAKTLAAVKAHLLSYGKRGYYVKWVQQRLTDLGFRGTMGTPDGIFGKNTKNAVLNFQKAKKLAADAIVGAETVKQLIRK